jgi:hypothetical protein
MQSVQQTLQAVLTNPWFLGVWIVLVIGALIVLVYDLRTHNPGIMPLMKVVWFLTVLYSGPVGLAIYSYSGRKQGEVWGERRHAQPEAPHAAQPQLTRRLAYGPLAPALVRE